MNRMKWAFEVSAWFTMLGIVVLTMLLITIKHDRQRAEQAIDYEQIYNPAIPLEVWQEFQDCIEPHPSDGVCDSCWKAIIVDKYHITPESHE